jgi:hypothetical protein
MTEASGLQAVFDRFLDDFKHHPPLSPDQEREPAAISNSAALKPWAGCSSNANTAVRRPPSSIPAATAIVPHAKAGPNRGGVNNSSKRSCR